MKWTSDQLEAIESKGKNILVAAAAGSGKTAVLVERIIQKIIKQNIDIDKLLVVTFTNAAASEIRQRILEAIYSKLEEEPENENLQRQIILLNKSNISTIHSFCLSVIKNNFFEIGISPDFRIGDTSELELLKLETIDDVFEELYEASDSNFIKLTEIYTGYRGDENLKELVLKIYKFIQSSPFPREWLREQIVKFDLTSVLKNDFSTTVWGDIILKYIRENIQRNITELKVVLTKLNEDIELKKFYDVILLDIEQYEYALKSLETWDTAYKTLNNLEFKKWPADRKVQGELKDKSKGIRKEINDNYKKIVNKLMVSDSLQSNKDLLEMYNVLVYLEDVINKFMDRFIEKKQKKNIIDFNDIEHYALQILVKKEEKTGKYVPTNVANMYKNKFVEIAIDEYQDSNLVQEYILSTISNGHNMFMVGDVKQSIYRFRQARPELFLEKYNNFKLKNNMENKEDINQKIQLFNNFRSRELVLEFANLVFKNIMSKNVGDLDYTDEEHLNFTGLFVEPLMNDINYSGKMSLEILDLKNMSGQDANKQDNDYDDENSIVMEELQENLEKIEIEARYVALRIKEIIESKYNVYDKELKSYRCSTYKDFVILLRSTANVAPIFEKEIENLNMPVFSDVSQKYLKSIEIETILNLLKIIDNPMQDIALVSVLRSFIGGFDDNELLEIRLNNVKSSFYESMNYFLQLENLQLENLKCKTINFLNKLKEWQQTVKYMSLDEFVWKIYIDTGYYNYVSMMNDGEIKTANLKMLFERAKQYESASFKGLYNFIKFIDKLKKTDGDMSNAKLIGEKDNVIRIMSIHKSKGLEFPIVFLSATGKKFNLRDLNDNILLHQDLGLGPKYINYERKIEYNTIAKEALKIKLKDDSLSEEMRVLYVALTRPKEKLIITGTDKDIFKKIEQKKILLEISESKDINSLLIKKYNTYLDWLELAYLNSSNIMDNCIDFKILDLNGILKEYNSLNDKIEINNCDLSDFLNTYDFNNNEYEKIEKLLRFEYQNQALTKIKSKFSVSEIKELLDRSNKKENGFEDKFLLEKPKFMEKELKLKKAEIGTIIHLIFQKINLRKNYTKESLEKEIDALVTRKIITKEERQVVDIESLHKFVLSDFANRIKNAKAIYKESPFYMNIDVGEIPNEVKNTEENVLVQGIIDLYFEEDDKKLVLVDYKTDYILNGEEEKLINKHKEQLMLYKRALENATNKEVKEVYLYSTCISKAIRVK